MPTRVEISEIHTFGRSVCRPDWKVEEEFARYHRLYYCYGGAAVYRSSGERVALNEGTFYLFPIHKSYSMRHDPDKPLNTMWFHVSLNRMILDEIIDLPAEYESPVDHILKVLEDCLIGNRTSACLKHALNILVELIAEKRKFETVEDPRVVRATEYMERNYGRKITNETLAGMLHIDPRHFIRIFKRSCGCTPQAYLASIRILKAMDLLLEKEKVYTIARKVGYEDPKAFSRFFKQYRGVSPAEFRESHYLQP